MQVSLPTDHLATTSIGGESISTPNSLWPAAQQLPQRRYEHSYEPPSEKYYKTSNDEASLLVPVIGRAAHTILGCLRSHLNSRTGQCNPSINTIANELDMAPSTVKVNLAYLYQAGIVRCVARQFHHSRRGTNTVQRVNNQYILLARSRWTLDKVTRARAKAPSTHRAPVLVELWPADEPGLVPLVAQDDDPHQESNHHKVASAPPVETQASDAVPDVAVAAGTGAAPVPAPEASALLAQVLAVGVKAPIARALLASSTLDIIRLQLAYLDDREPRDRAATLVKSIRDNWSPPAKYLQRVDSEEAVAQEAERQAAVAQAAQQRQTEASAREQQQSQSEAKNAQLDAQWEALNEAARSQIEEASRQRLGVLARSANCAGAMRAMRRALLHEMAQTGQLAAAQGNAGARGLGRLEV